jgi:hypothetical protein
MSFVVQNKNGDFLSLTERTYKDEPIKLQVKNELLDRYAQYGAVGQGDGKFSSRKMSFKFDVIKKLQVDFRYVFNRIASFFVVRDEPFYLIDLNSNIRCRVRLNSLDPNWKQGLEKLIAIDNSLELELLDGLWESAQPTEIAQTTLSNNDTLTVQCDLVCIETKPIFYCISLATNTDFALINMTTGQNMRIQELGFVTDKVITIDNVEGLIDMDGNFNPLMMSAGGFFDFRNGDNVLKYQSPSGAQMGLRISYRQRYNI